MKIRVNHCIYLIIPLLTMFQFTNQLVPMDSDSEDSDGEIERYDRDDVYKKQVHLDYMTDLNRHLFQDKHAFLNLCQINQTKLILLQQQTKQILLSYSSVKQENERLQQQNEQLEKEWIFQKLEKEHLEKEISDYHSVLHETHLSIMKGIPVLTIADTIHRFTVTKLVQDESTSVLE